MAVPWTAIYELIWKTALYCLYSTCRSAPQRLSGRAPQPYSVKTAGKSELVPGQVVPASTTQEFHVKYKYTLYEQTHKCLVNVFYLCIDILPDVNLNVLIVMQNLCEYSISCKNSKYEFYIKILNS